MADNLDFINGADASAQISTIPEKTEQPKPPAPPKPPKKRDRRPRGFGYAVWDMTKTLAKRWFITGMGGMALGLFATLIAGTIIKQIGVWIGDNGVGSAFQTVGFAATVIMGAGIGAGVAHSLKASRLVLFSTVCAGFIGAQSAGILGGTIIAAGIKGPGDPIAAFICAVAACEIGNKLCGKTKVDIVVLPLSALLIAMACVFTVCRPVSWVVAQIGAGIAAATTAQPLIMGIVVAGAVGLLLTLPTSSAAICITMQIGGLAGGAAVVGCAAQMVGFAVMSFKENRVSGLIAQGVGTSMLQLPNLMKNPRILIPPTVAGMISGALATTVFGLQCSPAGSGMGTAGLVGVFETVSASLAAGVDGGMIFWGIAVLFFAIPTAVCIPLRILLSKIGWIKKDDLKLYI
ncbi:MAG: PTS sugar transporter subunit IIC [Clostridiales bacterium]|jgi:uncharacterized membrane protein|nr:PTS sugar transporter subunit IIC [Clostridiales bacterium]